MTLYGFIAQADYFLLGAAALWGLYCITIVWRHVAQRRFRNEREQVQFLEGVEKVILRGQFEEALDTIGEDSRAVPAMVRIAIENRDLGKDKLADLLFDRFQYDVMGELQDRVSWVSTIIKASPMLGLIGTVAGMMGAFETLEKATASEPTKQLLADIRTALDHTLIGLLITVTLLIVMGTINNRVRQMEELAVFGVNRFLDALETAIKRTTSRHRAM